jgi:hypothetical protein
MSLETGNYIFNLDSSNPTGADPKSRGDDHFRLIKGVVKNSFAGFTGAVIVTGNNGGAVNAYTLTPTPPLPSYVLGMEILFFPTATNTGACTLNISALGDIPIVSVSNVTLVAGDLVAMHPYRATYDGTNFRLNSITKNYVDQLAFNTALPAQPGGNIKYVLSSFNSVASWSTIGVTRVPRTSNVQLTEANGGNLIDITTGGFTQTFATGLSNGWYCYIKNSSSTAVTIPASDGLTNWKMYPGELRLFQYNGATYTSYVITPFDYLQTVTETYIHPPGYTFVEEDSVAAGGGGGSGRKSNANPKFGGAPGGTPARRIVLHRLTPGQNVASVIGAKGVGGASQTTNDTNGNNGTAGGSNTFGSLTTTYGGVGGAGGGATGAATSGSGWGGAGVSGGGAQQGGLPSTTFFGGTTTGLNNLEGGGGGCALDSPGGCSVWGGAGSSHRTTVATSVSGAGSSLNGVPAGSPGAGFNTTLEASATAAGSRRSYVAGGGAVGGTSNASGNATAGGNGTAAGANDEVGTSGAGGGCASGATGNGGNGGDGGFPGGAGGGGGASSNNGNSGKGGDGADGRKNLRGIV